MLSTPPELARSALDAAPDAMIIVDGSGVILFANRRVAALFGYPHDEVIGQPVESLMPERFRDRHVAHRQDYIQSVRIRPMGVGLELFGRRRSGEEFPVEISLSPIQDSGRVLVAAAIRDVSDRKRVEADLMVARQAAERAREVADRANQGKSRFLATASHDLRQPLQSLSLLNGVLRRLIPGPEAEEVLAHQELAIGAMSRLLNALLDISKLESGAVKPDPADFAVGALFEELRLEFASLAASKGLTFQIASCTDCVRSDRSLVDQILRNLISNAIKYTRKGSVALRCLHELPSLVRIEVIDTGIGIPAEQLRYIFDEFYQVGVPTNSSREGYGLGLSIVQRLVSLLELTLDVRSDVGQGSVFALTLPAAAAGAVSAPQADREAPVREPQGPVRVLLVEDDVSVRDATRMLLRSEGYHVTAVASLAEALEHASRDPSVDLLVTDYHLRDGETGMQVIAAVRAALRASLKAVLITGDSSSAMYELPLDPLLRVVIKPMKADALLGILTALLNS
jgi:two-component system, sensor histidine kinase